MNKIANLYLSAIAASFVTFLFLLLVAYHFGAKSFAETETENSQQQSEAASSSPPATAALESPTSPPSCIDEQITIQQLRQQNAVLTQQLLQAFGEIAQSAQRLQPLLQEPFKAAQEEVKSAEKERGRLEGLRNGAAKSESEAKK